MLATTSSCTNLKRRWLLPNAVLVWYMFYAIVTQYHAMLSSTIHNHVENEDVFQPEEVIAHQRRLSAIQQGNKTETEEHSTLPPVAIFFHIYVPKDEDIARADHVDRATKIIRQQLRTVSEGLATVNEMEPATLYYTTVGRELEAGYVEKICQDYSEQFHCHHLQHLDQGFEEHTLGALYDHCQEHEEDRVIYLHTKGSFHGGKTQSRWRRHMTDAVASRDCIERAHNEDCDLCGLLYLPRPGLHFTGNMFNAKCSYIQKLVHPMEFEEKMAQVDAKAHALVNTGTLQSNLLNMDEAWNAGTERFSMEHWHGSHPSVQKICDVSRHSQIQYWQQIRAMDRKPGDWEFAVFPRHPVTAEWSHGFSDRLAANVLNDESRRKREYFLLPGQLMKWFELYGEAPPSSSWVWSWYPDGQFWKEQVEKHGTKAVEAVASQWSQPIVA